MEKLQDRAMLVRLSVSQWTARKKDKRASKHVAEHYGADQDAVATHKALVAKRNLEEIQKIAGEMRTYHYDHTVEMAGMPGYAILTNAMFPEYMAKSSELANSFRSAVAKFLHEYPALRDAAVAKASLGGLYDEGDYPSESDMARKFKLGVDFTPIPEGNHLSINISEDDLAEIQASIEARVRDAEQAAMAELWQRVYDVTAAMAERMTDKNGEAKGFHDSLIGNIQKLAELLPKLNVSGDPNLDMISKELVQDLGRYNPGELRRNEHLRKEAKGKADSILARVTAAMGGTAGAGEELPEAPEIIVHPVAEIEPSDIKGLGEPEPGGDDDMLAKLRKAGIL